MRAVLESPESLTSLAGMCRPLRSGGWLVARVDPTEAILQLSSKRNKLTTPKLLKPLPPFKLTLKKAL